MPNTEGICQWVHLQVKYWGRVPLSLRNNEQTAYSFWSAIATRLTEVMMTVQINTELHANVRLLVPFLLLLYKTIDNKK